jgi:hypothetical protein
MGAAVLELGQVLGKWGRSLANWGRCFVIGEAVLKNALRMEAGGIVAKKFSGQGALLLRDGFRKNF